MLLVLVFVGLWVCMPQYSYADNSENLEAKLKAVYLIHLGEFIEWPNTHKMQDSFSICIDPGEPINSYLQEVSQHLVQGKPLKIINTLDIEQFKTCHIVYIGSAQLLKNPMLPQFLVNNSVLTVSSVSGLIEQGGSIEFYIKNNKVRMRINLAASKKSGLVISSKLLRLMEIVNP